MLAQEEVLVLQEDRHILKIKVQHQVHVQEAHILEIREAHQANLLETIADHQ